MSLIRKSDFGPTVFDVFEDVDRIFNSVFPNTPVTTSTVSPRVDFYETEGNYVLKAEMPGWKEDDIEIVLKEGTLILRGENKVEIEEASENEEPTRYFRQEIKSSSFSRKFRIGRDVDEDGIEASLKGGILEVIMPKSVSEDKTKRISIESLD